MGRCAAVFVLSCGLALAQGSGGGGAGGAAGAGGGSGASGPGAAAAAAAAHGSSGQSGTPQGASSATAPQPGTAGQVTPQQYAAGAAVGPDPRKPPKSRPGALTLAQVVALAEAQNPTLQAAQANLRSVRAQELQAGVRTNPYFTLYGTNVTLPAAGASNPYQYSGQVSRLFELGNKRGLRLDTARATTAQTAAQLEDQIRQTVLEVKTAFTHMLVAKEALELASAGLQDYRHEVEISLERYQAGDLGKLDYERLDLQLGSFESDESNDIVGLRQASDQLQTLMGIETPSPTFDITGDVVPPAIQTTEADLVKQGLAARPDFAATRSAVVAADSYAKLQRANGLWDPTLEGEYDRSGRYDSAGFSINVPIRIFDHNQGNIAAAQLQSDVTRLTVRAAHNQVISDVDQAWIGYTEARRLSDRFGDHYLDESADVLSIAQYAFEHGGIALIDYLDALRGARTSISGALNAYQATWLALHQLSAASATELTP